MQPDKNYIDLIAQLDEEIYSGFLPPAETMSIQSYGDPGECTASTVVHPIANASWSGNAQLVPSGADSTAWQRIDEPVDTPDTSNYIRYLLSYPGPDTVTTVSDTFKAGGIPRWPVWAKIRINASDHSGGGASGQFYRCSWKDKNSNQIGITALDDIPSVIGTTPQVFEMDLELNSINHSADLSETIIGLRVINGNVCDIHVNAIEVLYGYDCSECSPEQTCRPNGTDFDGWLGDIISTSPPMNGWEILATNNFTDSDYDRYVKVVESVGTEPYTPAAVYSIGEPLQYWPTTATVRLRYSQEVFSTAIAVEQIQIYDNSTNDLLASWDGGYTVLAYTTSPATATFELVVEDYDENVDLSNLIVSVGFSMSAGSTNDTDFRMYALACDFEGECSGYIDIDGGAVGGGEVSTSMIFSPTPTGGAVAGGEPDDLRSGLLALGGAVAGGTVAVSCEYNLTTSGGATVGGFPYRYRKAITIPADSVNSDLTNFLVGLIIQVEPSKAGSNWLFTSSQLEPLAHEIREYTASGQLTAYVKTNLSASSDTIIYLYYGAP